MPLEISRDLLARAVDQSHDGITVADAQMKDWPLLYVNAGFERLTGYSTAELLGKSCHLLQGTDTNQPEISVLRDALHQGTSCVVTLRNYRRDGSMFWNELSLSPVRNDAGALTHYIGIQHDVTARILPDQHLHQSAPRTQTDHTDLLTGIGGHFEEQFSHMLQTAQRSHSLLSVLAVQPDEFKHFNERYGRAAGNACLRMVGERIAKSFGRSLDCVAYHNENAFAVVSIGTTTDGLQQHLVKLRDQVRALNIPHHDTPDGVVTICIGGVNQIPQRDTTTQDLLAQAYAALQKAKKFGHDCEHLV